MSNDNTMELLASREARDAQMDNVWVLNKIGALMSIPGTDYITTEMVANYYEVPIDSIQKIYTRHNTELKSDGVRIISAKDLNGQDVHLDIVNVGKTCKHITYPNGIEFNIPNRGMRIYPRRAVLRVGMLLTNSDIAKAIRTALLNAADSHQTLAEQVTQPQIDKDKTAAYYEDQIKQRDERLAKYELKLDRQDAQLDKCLSILEILLQRQIELEAPVRQHAAQKSKTKPSITVTTKNMSRTPTWDEWRMEINNIVKDISDLTCQSGDSILHEAYQRLDGQYGLCTSQCLADYRKVHMKQDPAMMSVMYWYETEKNPESRGLLASVLNTMCDEMLLKAA